MKSTMERGDVVTELCERKRFLKSSANASSILTDHLSPFTYLSCLGPMKDEDKSLELGAVSSVVEHYLDTVGVTGSNPVSRTIFFRRTTTCALSSKTNASIVTLFCLDGRIEGQASDVVFADDDGCVFVRSEKCRGVTCNRPENFLGGSGNKRKQSRPDGRCAHNWTSPVTFRSEQPTQSHISRSPAKHRRRHRRKRFLLIFYPFRSSRRFLLQSAVLRPLPFPMALISRYVDPIAGSSLAGGTSPAASRYRRRAQD